MIDASNLEMRRKGQSLVEFALSLPVLLLILVGVLDFGRIMFTYAQASNNLRNALRYGVIVGYQADEIPNYQNCAEMRAIASQVWFANPASNQVTINYIQPTGTTSCTGSTAPSDLNLDNGDILQVRLQTTVDLITPFLAGPLAIDLQGQRTIVRSIELPRLGVSGGEGAGPSTPSETCADIIDGNDPTVDSDGDGLPDLWECTYFGSLDQGPDDNPDGDLCNNLCEYTLGSNPNDPTSPNSIPGTPQQLEDEGANACSVLKTMRYVGLTWPQLAADPPVTGYRLYATPANGPRIQIGDIPAPANAGDPVLCGYSQAGNVGGVLGCFNAIEDASGMTPSQFWLLYGSRTINYSIRAYSPIGQSQYSNLAAYDCVFRVTDIALRPEGEGLLCETAPDKQAAYTGLQWTAHPDAVRYIIYASKIEYDPQTEPDPPPEVGLIEAIPGLTTMVCGYSVDDVINVGGTNYQGCFNVRKQAWNSATDYTSFMVVPVNALGVIGPYQEAIPPYALINPPVCKN